MMDHSKSSVRLEIMEWFIVAESFYWEGWMLGGCISCRRGYMCFGIVTLNDRREDSLMKDFLGMGYSGFGADSLEEI